MDAFELLENDHDKVSGIFEQLESSAGQEPAAREKLFAQLKNELTVHAHIEETIFYPALRQADETREITLEAIEEHQQVKDMLAELEAMPVDDGEWSDLLTELKDAVEHHVDEEEGEMFLKARTVLSQEQITELGQRMATQKQQRMAAGAI